MKASEGQIFQVINLFMLPRTKSQEMLTLRLDFEKKNQKPRWAIEAKLKMITSKQILKV